MAFFRVKSGPQKGKLYEVRNDSLVIGRDSGGDIQVLDQGVSRRHAEIFRIGEMYFIRDLESRNGTYVNDQKISEELLRIGDQIRIGQTVLVFEDRLARLRDTSRVVRAADEAEAVPSPSSTIVMKVAKGELTEAEKETIESRNLNVLLHLSHIIAEEKDLSRLFSRVSDLLGKTLQADHLYFFGVKGGASAKMDFEILGRYDRVEEDDETAGVSRGIIRDCLKHSRSVLTSDASLDHQFSTMASVVMKNLRSVICVPVSLQGRELGVIYIYSNRADAFLPEDLELASAVGIQLGGTIELLRMIRRCDRFFRSSIKTLVSAIEMKSPEVKGRSERVATYCLAVAKELGLGTQEIRDAWLSGMLHDVGSIPMTREEIENRFTAQTRRNRFARQLLKGTAGLEHLLPALEQQDERHDGSGSPEGRKGGDIVPLARILGLALEFDRLLSPDGPGAELSVKEVLLKVKEMADRQFSREVVNALLIAYRNGKLFNQDEEFFEVPLD